MHINQLVSSGKRCLGMYQRRKTRGDCMRGMRGPIVYYYMCAQASPAPGSERLPNPSHQTAPDRHDTTPASRLVCRVCHIRARARNWQAASGASFAVSGCRAGNSDKQTATECFRAHQGCSLTLSTMGCTHR
jgi:hypothetical protein